VTRLFKWIMSFFRRVPADVYDPGERLIYSYFDGTKTVRVDPIVLHRKIMAKAPELDNDIKAAECPVPNSFTEIARKSLLKNLREIFSVRELDQEGGLTETETTDLFSHFMNFCHEQKKNTSPTPTSSGPTSPDTRPSSGGARPTGNTSASGSTASDPTFEKLPPSNSACASPSDSPTPDSSIGRPAAVATARPS